MIDIKELAAKIQAAIAAEGKHMVLDLEHIVHVLELEEKVLQAMWDAQLAGQPAVDEAAAEPAAAEADTALLPSRPE